MSDESFDWKSTSVGIAIGIILAILLKCIYSLYNRNNRIVDRAYFVMIDDNCCNPYKTNGYQPGSQCKKYCPGQLFEKILTSIQSARASICICMFNFTNQKLARCIANHARRQGVNVRVVLDKSTYDDNDDNKEDRGKKTTVAEIFKEKGVAVRILGEGNNLMHNKFCLIDGTAIDGVLITGSLNWTYNGMNNNCENVTFIHSKKIRNEYRTAFDRIWNKSHEV